MNLLNLKFVKFGLTVALLVAVSVGAHAFEVDGYIVKLNNDTVYGCIQLSRFDRVTGALILHDGFDEESLHTQVYFSAGSSHKFQQYTPEMINAFYFRRGGTSYVFRRVLVTRKSIFSGETETYRFMRLNGKQASPYDASVTPNPGLISNQSAYLKYDHKLVRVDTDSINKKSSALK